MTLRKQDRVFVNIKGRLAQVLLDHAGGSTGGQNHLTHRDMAAMLNTDWDMIHSSLVSLNNEGAIKIDRHRIIVEPERLQKVAGGKSWRVGR
jgi:hypothetical protein